jgi:hypothetical protein
MDGAPRRHQPVASHAGGGRAGVTVRRGAAPIFAAEAGLLAAGTELPTEVRTGARSRT